MDDVPQAAHPTRRCFEVVAERSSPCTDCPVLGSGNEPRIAARRVALGFELVRVERLVDSLAHLSSLRVEDDELACIQRTTVAAAATTAGLTERERRVLNELLRGREIVEIARELTVAVRTVKFHQANLFRKLKVDSRHALARLFCALEEG